MWKRMEEKESQEMKTWCRQTCKVKGCKRQSKIKGFCNRHYNAQRVKKIRDNVKQTH